MEIKKKKISDVVEAASEHNQEMSSQTSIDSISNEIETVAQTENSLIESNVTRAPKEISSEKIDPEVKKSNSLEERKTDGVDDTEQRRKEVIEAYLKKITEITTPFIQELEITWPVNYSFAPMENTCRIRSSSVTHQHEVLVHAGVLENPEFYLCDLVHELCHASLAEKIDPSFATLYFSRCYGDLVGEARQNFNIKAQQLFLSYAHIDVWINEYRHKFFPDLTLADHDSFFYSIKEILKFGEKVRPVLEGFESLLAMAVHLTDIDRLGLEKQDFSQVFNFLSLDSGETLRQLHQFCKDLPQLTFQPKKDMAILLESVQTSAKKFKRNIFPQIIEEDGHKVWLV